MEFGQKNRVWDLLLLFFWANHCLPWSIAEVDRRNVQWGGGELSIWSSHDLIQKCNLNFGLLLISIPSVLWSALFPEIVLTMWLLHCSTQRTHHRLWFPEVTEGHSSAPWWPWAFTKGQDISLLGHGLWTHGFRWLAENFAVDKN